MLMKTATLNGEIFTILPKETATRDNVWEIQGYPHNFVPLNIISTQIPGLTPIEEITDL